MKDYLGDENARNKKHAALYERMIKQAFGATNDVLVGHHLTFEVHGNIDTENEIPAADTLLFDHPLMTACFGKERALKIMQAIAVLPADGGLREQFVAGELTRGES